MSVPFKPDEKLDVEQLQSVLENKLKLENAAGKAYDYIICGGGTAGLCVAGRLSEDPSVTVLVLEAGAAHLSVKDARGTVGVDDDLLRPASYAKLFEKPQYASGYMTIPQTHSNDKQYIWPRGKGLGGSSAVNFMAYNKPTKKEIDDLERLGNKNWNWKNYQKYSHKSERFALPDELIQKQRNLQLKDWDYGRVGLVHSSFPPTIISAELDMHQTYLNTGINVANNPLGGDHKGCFLGPSSYDPLTHTRSFATTAYYLPHADRHNLTVAINALVHKVLTEVDPSTGQIKATGVEVSSAGITYKIQAKKEVIISTGAIKTPQILELSGIGKREVLEKVGIDVKLDLPVGENVQDHIFTAVTWELKDDVSFDTLDILHDTNAAMEHIDLHKSGQGLFTTGLTGFVFVSLDQLSSKAKADEIFKKAWEKIMATDNTTKYPSGLVNQYDIMFGRADEGSPGCELITLPSFMPYGPVKAPTPGRKYMSVFVCWNHPFSRGTIHSRTADPADEPEIDPKYFSEAVDLDVMVEMAKYVRKLADQVPFKNMVAAEVNPGMSVSTDEEVAEWIKNSLSTTWHTAGSASMLPQDKGGVVDHQLKVYGTSNLRVVDLSIVPLHFSAHTVASVYAFAEQAADIIKGNFVA